MSKLSSLFQEAKDSFGFILIFLGIFALLAGLAWLAERYLIPKKRTLSSARKISYIAMFAALAAVLMFFEIPIPFLVPSFYKLDFSEIPVLICTLYLGPVAGVLCELVKILLDLLIFSGTSTAFVGEFANFFIGCSLILPASMIYHRKKSKKSAILGLAVGTAVMTIFGSAFNAFYLIPTYARMYFGEGGIDMIVSMGTAVNSGITDVTTLVLFGVVPFNILKGILVSVITMLLYKRVERIFFRAKQ